MTKDTAILFFHNTSLDEANSKNWLHNNGKKNQILAEKLIKETFNKVNKAGLPVISINSSIQNGNTFGEKLTNAILSVYNLGFQKVIVVGSDCPKLSVLNIKQTSQFIADDNIVLGPDTNGGVYLIALHKNNFDKQLFVKLPWNTKDIFNALVNYSLEVQACLTYLQKRADFHKRISVSSYFELKNLLPWELVKKITSLFTPIYTTNIFAFLFIPHITLTYKSLRAPPIPPSFSF